MLWTLSLWGRSVCVLAKGCHVPLIVRWPRRVAAGSATSELISGEDLAPTLLAAAGINAPEAMTGRSFLPLLANEPFTPRTEVYTTRGTHAYGLPHSTVQFDQIRATTTSTHRLIYNALSALPFAPVDIEDYGAPLYLEQLRVCTHLVARLPPLLSESPIQPTLIRFEGMSP